MNTWIRRVVTLVAIAGVVGGGYAAFGRGAGKKKDEVTYEQAPVTRRDLRSFVSATGVIQPWKTIDIKSNVAGKINQLYVDLGARVKPGDPIMDIDPTDTKAAHDQAQADLDAAKARIDQAKANLNQQERQTKAKIAAAERAVASAEARLAQSAASKEAQPKLTASGIAQARAALSSAQKSVLTAQQNKIQLQQRLEQMSKVTIPLNTESTGSNVEQARANLLTAQADLRRQRELLSMGYVSKADVDTAYARYATTQAGYRTAQQKQRTLQQENNTNLNEMKSAVAQADSQIQEAQDRVEQARASLALAQDNVYQNTVREKDYEAAKAAVEQEKQNLLAARAEAQQIEVRKKEIVAATSQQVRSQAALQQAAVNLGYTKIVAPSSGVIITKNVEAGTVVPSSRASIGSTNALLQIGDTSKLWVVCNVDETDIGQVSVGQKVTVKVDAYPSLLIDGKVIRINPQAVLDQNVTMIPVTVEITEPENRFKPGMNAECEFIVDEALHVLTVPNEAIKEDQGSYKVQQLVNGQPKEIEVEVGLAGQDATEIRGGLQEGEQVITKTIVPEKAEANNPFGNPFGRPQRRNNNAQRGAAGGARGGGR